ncbi:hypothetical protein [Rummeliibacillus sp. SL167]|uniref:hypothetical protein n=1 Tax=Rummeliibacillus sp. SL167 TaxID=2579792 RepID=UPI0011B72C88|nr:hypothetical protein [Rummeliibacillus sp. SL167]
MDIDIEKIKRRLAEVTRDLEKVNAERGYCMLKQKRIDPELCANAAAMVVDEATEFIVAVADLLLKTNEFPDLRSDAEIVAKIERWIDLLGVAMRMDSLHDNEVYWRYKNVDGDCILLSASLHCLIRDKAENARRGFTPLCEANYLTESLAEIIAKTKGFECFEYDYSAIIAENKEWSRLAEGER